MVIQTVNQTLHLFSQTLLILGCCVILSVVSCVPLGKQWRLTGDCLDPLAKCSELLAEEAVE